MDALHATCTLFAREFIVKNGMIASFDAWGRLSITVIRTSTLSRVRESPVVPDINYDLQHSAHDTSQYARAHPTCERAFCKLNGFGRRDRYKYVGMASTCNLESISGASNACAVELLWLLTCKWHGAAHFFVES